MKRQDQKKGEEDFMFEELIEDELDEKYTGEYDEEHEDGYEEEYESAYEDEDEEYGYRGGYDEEYDDLDDSFSINPKWVPAIVAGLIVLAVIICALLWMFTHRKETGVDKLPQNAVETSAEMTQEDMIPDDMTSEETDSDTVGQPAENGEQPLGDENGQDVVSGGDAALAPQEPVSGTISMEFTRLADTVTAKDVTNLRSVPSTTDAENVIAQLQNGESISRTGVNDSTGWSRLEYNGQTVYAVTQYLTTDLTYQTPVVQGDPNRVSTQDGRVIIFTDCDDNITPKEYVNFRVEPSTSQGQSTVNCQVNNGTTVHRTGYSPDSGWSRVEYNGTTLYVVTSLVNVVTEQ